MKSIIKRVLIGIVLILGVPVVILILGKNSFAVPFVIMNYWIVLTVFFLSVFVSDRSSKSSVPVDRSFKSSLKRAFIFYGYMVIFLIIFSIIMYFGLVYIS